MPGFVTSGGPMTEPVEPDTTEETVTEDGAAGDSGEHADAAEGDAE